MKNLTVKDYIILILLLGCIIFGYMTFFKGNKYYREEIKKLKVEYQKEQDLRKDLDIELANLRKQRDDLVKSGEQLQLLINLQDILIQDRKAQADKTRKELDETRLRIAEVRKKIRQVKESPANRTGDSLIYSLQLKTQK